MTRFLIRRLLWSALAILGVSTIVFVVLHFSGDPAALLLPPTGTREDYQALRRLLGLDRPLGVQYAAFLLRAARGDFARSFQYDQPSLEVVLERLPATFQLTAVAIGLIILVAVPLGVASAVFRNSWIDHMGSALTLAGQAAPNFWLGVMLILFFSVELRWLPTSGRGSLAHLVLPGVTLALQPLAKITRLTRSEMLDVLGQDFIRTARAKGLAAAAVVVRHALKNASIAIVTVIGLDLGYLLGGAIITESVFAWPGMGRLAVEAISNRDFPVVQAAVFVIALLVVAVNLAVDLVYVYLDPRVRLG
ncbi:MAG: ABC transporter permease [Armatimonadetes bacterium]|nr:ABC transporter permease [Armatimonadota bacterium]